MEAGGGAMKNRNHTHQSVSTVEREEAMRQRSSVVGRKDEGRQAAGCSGPGLGSEENSKSGEYGLILFLD
jgi:hypothetical protein